MKYDPRAPLSPPRTWLMAIRRSVPTGGFGRRVGSQRLAEAENTLKEALFVEDVHVFDSLKDLKIDYLQGYYLSEPADIAACPCPTAR